MLDFCGATTKNLKVSGYFLCLQEQLFIAGIRLPAVSCYLPLRAFRFIGLTSLFLKKVPPIVPTKIAKNGTPFTAKIEISLLSTKKRVSGLCIFISDPAIHNSVCAIIKYRTQYFTSHISSCLKAVFVPPFKQICISDYGGGQFSDCGYAIYLWGGRHNIMCVHRWRFYMSLYNKGKIPAIFAVVSHNFHFKSLL